MEGKTLNGILITIIIILFLSIYWFIPYDTTEFNTSSNSNFSINDSENSTLQFYPNMRFPQTNISYNIEKCPLKKENDMEWAFDIIENETILNFYSANYGQKITITCKDTNRFEGDLFIAGEGGPTSITIAGDFNIIEEGKILLIRDSLCERPNVAIHELLHVLGFDHSKNPKNIMFDISKCDQTIGKDIIEFINYIYSIPSQPDLLFENAYASMNGKYLDINFSIRNNGLKSAEESVVSIIVDGKEVKSIDVPSIEIGYGREVYMTNIWIKQISVQTVEFIIESDFEELNKINNNVIFEIKK